MTSLFNANDTCKIIINIAVSSKTRPTRKSVKCR